MEGPDANWLMILIHENAFINLNKQEIDKLWVFLLFANVKVHDSWDYSYRLTGLQFIKKWSDIQKDEYQSFEVESNNFKLHMLLSPP